MARIEPQKPHQTFNGSRELQRAVLAYLKEHGSQPYDILYVHFDPNRTPETQAVLHELAQWKFIEKGTDSAMTVSITPAGINRLRLKDIWKRSPMEAKGWTMSNKDEEDRIQANVEVIQGYLLSQFKGFELTDKPDRPISHIFTATKSADEQYRVKVSWPQLSDIRNTPEKTRKRLVTDDVAGRMRGKSQGEHFWWGKH
jgi:hypothetical protein